MGVLDTVRARWPKSAPFQLLSASPWARQRPTYREAKPELIAAALRRSQAQPSGNWYAFAASDRIGTARPLGVTVGGYELVAWRGHDGALHVGPGACPHLGADLSTGVLDCGALICPWHGLRLTGCRRIRLAALSVLRRRRAGLGASGPRRRRNTDRDAGRCRARLTARCTR